LKLNFLISIPLSGLWLFPRESLTPSHIPTLRGVLQTLPSCLNLRDPVSPPNMVFRGSLGCDQSPLLPPEAGLNLNPGSYLSDEQRSPPFAGSCTSPVPFCI
jgi:hypothetical protein